MKLMNALTVRGKLFFAFAWILLLMAVLGSFAVVQLGRVYGQAQSILEVRLPGVRDSQRMVEAATRYRVREYRLLVSGAQELAAAGERLEAGKADFEAARKDYAQLIADGTERQLYEQAISGWNAYLAGSARALPLLQQRQVDDAREAIAGAESLKRFDEALAGIKKLSEYNNTQAKADAAQAQSMFERGRVAVIASVLLALGCALWLGWLINRAISRPLREAVALAEQVARGDLSRDCTATGADEAAQVTRALGHMVARLRSVVCDVRSGVESVSTASSQIATGNLDLSQRTEEQASNLQQTAASMEQLTSTVRNNTENARSASRLASSATEVAGQGRVLVDSVVATMRSMTDNSKRICDITGVIDGIAFQTNILALNAAVEAARAGEQGRGFAVVADEVRALAQRSAQAAKQIKALIEESTAKVDEGARQVADAGQTMADIVQQVDRVNKLVGEISTASVEQSRGIEQVGEAVSQLDQVTQQNAALVEQSAAAADSLKGQAVRLAQTVAVFHLGRAAQTA